MEVQLSDVSDTDRFLLIELYKKRPVLWDRAMTGTREAVAAAWNSIAAGISTPERIFPVGLIQKILKNLRDQYVRLLRRGTKGNSSWKFQTVMSFLGTDARPPIASPSRKPKLEGQPPQPKSRAITPTPPTKTKRPSADTEQSPVSVKRQRSQTPVAATTTIAAPLVATTSVAASPSSLNSLFPLALAAAASPAVLLPPAPLPVPCLANSVTSQRIFQEELLTSLGTIAQLIENITTAVRVPPMPPFHMSQGLPTPFQSELFPSPGFDSLKLFKI